MAAIRGTGRTADNTRKTLIQIFKDIGLKITVQTNLKIVNYLDITLDLSKETYEPYRKPNDIPIYINAMSNHPPTVIAHIPNAVEKRLSTLSSNKKVFDKSSKLYKEALQKCGYKKNINYEIQKVDEKKEENKNKKRSRKIIWYNPPFSANVKTNIGRKFLALIKKHFPPENKFHKIFNKNTTKISYSCMKNMNSIIRSHNDKIIKQSQNNENDPVKVNSCNCRKSSECPLKGKCKIESIVYKATVTYENTEKIYIGLSGGSFKDRYRNHMKSFKHGKYANDTELSKHIWQLKRKNTKYEIDWTIL